MRDVALLVAVVEGLRELKIAVEGSAQLPMVLTTKRAARELSVSSTTLKLMIKRQLLHTVMIGRRRMVPASEIRRLATPVEKPDVKPKLVRSSLQDPEALKRRR